MTINASMYIGATGLKTYSTAMRVVSDNIANANTTAFKCNETQFGDLVSGYMPVTGSDTDRMGAGVSILGYSTNFDQGALVGSSSWSDLAVDGEGFFRVANFEDGRVVGPIYYTRDGSFRLDSDGYLVNSQGDAVLNEEGQPIRALEYPDNPEYTNFQVDTDGQIFGTRIRTVETDETSLAKPSAVTVSDSSLVQAAGVGDTVTYDLTGEASSVTITIHDKNGNVVYTEVIPGPIDPATNPGPYTWNWPGIDQDGNPVPPNEDYTYEVSTPEGVEDATTSSGTLTNVEAAGGEDSVSYSLTEDSYVAVNIYDEYGSLVRTEYLGQQTAGAQSWTGWNGVDDYGNQLTPGEFTAEVLTAPITGGVDTIDYTLMVDADVTFRVYDSDGNLVSIQTVEDMTEGDHTWSWNGRTDQGYPAPSGTYTFEITTSRDSATEAIANAQIQLSTFANVDGLIRQGSNYYMPGSESGDPITEGEALGGITDFNLESSNVDLAKEMINMVIYQATYNANSKTITTGDNMLTTTINMVR